MQIDPKIVEAGRPFQETSERDGELNARRVLKAASKCVPDDVVMETIISWVGGRDGWDQAELDMMRHDMHAALSAGLAKWAEEE